jgi:uncharacterized protein (DUF1778 family)
MASTRFEFRVASDSKQRIIDAARLLGLDASDFIRETMEERAEAVLAEHETRTVVPAAYFEDLLAALDAPAEPNAALTRALSRARQNVEADHLHG